MTIPTDRLAHQYSLSNYSLRFNNKWYSTPHNVGGAPLPSGLGNRRGRVGPRKGNPDTQSSQFGPIQVDAGPMDLGHGPDNRKTDSTAVAFVVNAVKALENPIPLFGR